MAVRIIKCETPSGPAILTKSFSWFRLDSYMHRWKAQTGILLCSASVAPSHCLNSKIAVLLIRMGTHAYLQICSRVRLHQLPEIGLKAFEDKLHWEARG